jgi:hypothetical protein
MWKVEGENDYGKEKLRRGKKGMEEETKEGMK